MVKKTDFDTKVTEIEGKIPNITGLATNSELSAVENKISGVSSLVKKTNLDAELKKGRVTSNKSRHLQIENELKKLQKFDAAYFRGKNYFDGNDRAQNSLVFQVGEKYFNNNSGSSSSKIEVWKSKGLSSQSLNLSGTVGTANDIKMSKPIRPAYVIFNQKDSFFEQKKENIIKSGSIVNIYIVYSLSQKTIDSDNVLKNCLFGGTKVTKPGDTTDTDKYIYFGYGLGFDSTGQFSHPPGGMTRNIITFGVNTSNSVHPTNKIQNILVLAHGLTQKVNNATIYAEKMYSPNFSAENKIFCLNLHYNGDNSYLFVNGKEVTKFKAKISEIKAKQLILGSISTSANLSRSDIEDSKLYGNVYDFSVD